MRHVANCSHTSVVLLSCVRPHCASSRPIGCNASGNVSRSEVVQGGEDAQADIPRISEVKLHFFGSRRNAIGIPSRLDVIQFALSPSSVFTARGAGTAILAGCRRSASPSDATSKGSRSSGTGSGRRRGTVQHPSPWWRYSAAKLDGHRSISPNTMSSEPMIAATSPSMCPRVRKSIACKCANEGARILHLYGRLVPSAMR